MTPQANLQDSGVFEELIAALVRYESETTECMTSASNEIQRTMDWLAQRENHWKRECERRQMVLKAAQEALRRCQTMYDDDRGNPCRSEEMAVRKAECDLYQSQSELANVRNWKNKVKSVADTYNQQAHQLKSQIENVIPKAKGYLQNKRSDIQDAYAGDMGSNHFDGATNHTDSIQNIDMYNDLHDSWYSRMLADEEDCVEENRDWSRNEEFNDYLRRRLGEDESQNEDIIPLALRSNSKKHDEEIVNALLKAPAMPEDGYVLRGTSKKIMEMDMEKPDPGFVSATYDPSIARIYAEKARGKDKNDEVVIMKICYKKGTKIGIIGGDEKEVLFQRGSRFENRRDVLYDVKAKLWHVTVDLINDFFYSS
jgi:hypothetical protein